MSVTRKRTEDFVDAVTCGDCNKLIARVESASVDGVVIDPPYGVGLEFEGDRNLQQATKLLGTFLRNSYRTVKMNGYVAVFWTSRNLDVCIDTLKESGFEYRRTLVMYVKRGKARPHLGWLPRIQPIVIGQRCVPGVHGDYHRRVAEYLSAALKTSRFTHSGLARELRCDPRLVMKWTRVGDPFHCLPTPRYYVWLKKLLKLDNTFDALLDPKIASARKAKRSDFSFHHDCYVISGLPRKKQHPAQKPFEVVQHIVTCMVPKGGIVLDGFAGSGTTAVAAKRSGRHFICFELDAGFCEVAKRRLRQAGTRKKKCKDTA